MSPELLNPDAQDYNRTERSDCYALGMVVYEVLSGLLPFYQYPDLVVVGKVVGGGQPERPQGARGAWFTDEVWETLERCWTPKPENRPGIGDVLQCLEKVSRSWVPLSPRLLAVPSPASSFTRGFSDIITAESMEWMGPPDIAALLDGLSADQNTDYLSNALRAAIKERELYSVYISSLEEDTKRVKELLEVFDKVRSARHIISWVGSQNR